MLRVWVLSFIASIMGASLLLGDVSDASGSQVLRVGILREQGLVALMSDRPIEVLSGGYRTVLTSGAHEITPGSFGIQVGTLGELEGPVRLVPTAGAKLFVAIRPYRGIIEIRRTPSGRLTAINELDLEEYLYGVLKMEVNPSWPAEALKAQAVAARTLAVYSLGRFRSEGYDLRATTESQVYGGISAEDPLTTAAVEATRGEIMTFGGGPIFAAYHSDSGGFTEDSERVWGGRYAYLKGVPDPFTAAAPWSVRIEVGAFEGLLRRAGKMVGDVTAVEVAGVTPSGRATGIRIASPEGVLTLRATDLRSILGPAALKSTMFTVRMWPGEPALLEFAGRGAGHGVGLSQWGARGQALIGKTYQDILRYYYSGIAIQSR